MLKIFLFMKDVSCVKDAFVCRGSVSYRNVFLSVEDALDVLVRKRSITLKTFQILLFTKHATRVGDAYVRNKHVGLEITFVYKIRIIDFKCFCP